MASAQQGHAEDQAAVSTRAQSRLSASLREKVLARDRDRCRYCGEAATEVDHVIPWSVSRSHAPENLVACCGPCNRVARNNVFPSFADKKMFILDARKKREDQRSVRRARTRSTIGSPVIEGDGIENLAGLIQVLARIDARVNAKEPARA